MLQIEIIHNEVFGYVGSKSCDKMKSQINRELCTSHALMSDVDIRKSQSRLPDF